MIAVALAAIAGATNVAAQIIAIGPPSFQSNDFPSMETLILDRLAMGGQYNPAGSRHAVASDGPGIDRDAG